MKRQLLPSLQLLHTHKKNNIRSHGKHQKIGKNAIETKRTRFDLHEKFYRINKKVIFLTDTMKTQRNIITYLKEKDNVN